MYEKLFVQTLKLAKKLHTCHSDLYCNMIIYMTNLPITKPERSRERAPLIWTEVLAGIESALQDAGLRSSEPHLPSLTPTAQPPPTPTARRTTYSAR